MKFAKITERLADLGGAKWDLHNVAQRRKQEGADIIDMTIGEPDVPVPDSLIDAASRALHCGRTGYSNGRGEDHLRQSLAQMYTQRRGRGFERDNILCFPGTQTALFSVVQGVADPGDEVLVGDPLYATYEGVIRATGATMVSVPLRAEEGFRMQAAEVAARITDRTVAILLNTPHNPTGAVLRDEEMQAIAALALEHDLWIIADEVYEELVFEGHDFVSPLSLPEVADRTIAVSSISKSHAAPGFRSGWAVAPKAFCDALLPVSETMLFGNQPFIADMTAQAIEEGSSVASSMRISYAARAARLAARLQAETELVVHQPQAGMFAMINPTALGMDGETFAWALLDQANVALMPGVSFGAGLKDWVRVALTIEDSAFDEAIERILTLAHNSVAQRSTG